MYEITEKLIPINKYTRPSRLLTSVRGIVIHWTANRGRGANALAHYKYFSKAQRYASAHYFVDDHSIYKIIPENEVAYHAGNKIFNSTTIGIEMCVNADGDFYETYKRTVWLVANILKRYKLDLDSLVRHHDVTGKDCPKYFVHDIAAFEFLNMSADKAYEKFRSDVGKELRKEESTLEKKDADKIIKLLSAMWGFVSSKEEREEIHRLANELRKASGQEVT